MIGDDNKFAVYFDGSCPLCRREIEFYRARTGGDEIEWLDVSTGRFISDDLDCAQAMARFHIRRQDGQLLSGGKAFAALWKELRAFRILGVLFSLPVFSWFLDRAYDVFLPLRPHLQRLAAVKEKRTPDEGRP